MGILQEIWGASVCSGTVVYVIFKNIFRAFNIALTGEYIGTVTGKTNKPTSYNNNGEAWVSTSRYEDFLKLGSVIIIANDRYFRREEQAKTSLLLFPTQVVLVCSFH